MGEEVRFLHAADLHLDSPFKGLVDTPAAIFQEIRESTFQAVNRLVQTAIEKQVDFILITGDLFDNEKQSLKAQIHLKRAFEKLKEKNIAVYLSYGNHDYINGNVHDVSYPDNVFIFPDEEVRSFLYEKDGVPLASISGFSYVDRAVTENKAKEFHIIQEEAAFHIAMLHGSVQGNEEHAPYAPFQIADLTAKDFDYWALGHIHKRKVIKEDPLIVYPGNTQGRHRKETGEKGCYDVRLSKTGASLDFISLQSLLFTPIYVDISALTAVYQLESLILHSLEKQSAQTPELIDLTLRSENDQLHEWQSSGQLQEIVELLNEDLAMQTPWKFIFRTTIKTEKKVDATITYGEHFFSELNKRLDESHLQEYLKQLYQHKRARKYLDKPDEALEEEVREEARTRLMKALLEGGSQ